MQPQFSDLKFDPNGLIPAIVQDAVSGQVLMMAWMNREALSRTIQTGKTHFFSRSRNKLWLKGESSGHRLVVKEISTDCDQDALLFRVEVEGDGLVCHEGTVSCFTRPLTAGSEVQA